MLQFLVVAVAGWINQQPRDVIDALQEEHRVLREARGPGRHRVTDAQRRRRAAKATRLGRRVRRDRHTLVTPDTLLRWHRQLIARQYDDRGRRGPRRPRVMDTDPPAHRCFRHQLLLPRPYLILTKPLRLDIQCQRGASVKIGWKYLDD